MSDAARLRRLQEVIARATAAPSPREVAKVIVDQGVAALDGSIGALWLLDGGATLDLVHWVGVAPGRRFRRVALGSESPLALAVRTATPVWIGSRAEYVAAFPQSDQHTGSDQEVAGELACACLPLRAGAGAIGGLMFAFRQARELDDDERMFLVAIASQCANAIERLRLLERAEAANRAKDEFLALLGHELRNPLAPIASALDLMKLRPAGDHERERAIIERQVVHLVRLVDDLLDVARIARGDVGLDRRPVRLADAIAVSVEAAQPIVHARHHRLELDVPDELVVDADLHRLAQAIGNLVGNAAKYTPDGGVVSVHARADGAYARISVRDNGIGLLPHLLPHVFDMFVQGERTIDRSKGGLGLGLAVVKSMVERHGGRVEARSDGPGTGATFTVWWPLAQDAPEIAARATSTMAGGPALRVLVVDDNVDAAETLSELVRALGHEPMVAHDAQSALAFARDEAPHLALVDLGLPIHDGFELMSWLRELPGLGALRTFAVTGYGQASDRARTRAAGFDGHVVKPVGLDDLRSLLASL